MSEEKENNKKTIIFNTSKKETHNPNNGFKKLNRKLKGFANVLTNKEDISTDGFAEADVMVFGGSREPFTAAEFKDIKSWLSSGGRALVLLSEGGEKQSGSNLNYLLEEFGMSVNNDSVTRSAYYKYMHPKEVFIADGVLVPDIARKKNIVQLGGSKKSSKDTAPTKYNLKDTKMNFVYPYGASLNVQKPSIPFLSSGPISYPMNRPIAAMWESETVANAGAKRGRMVVIGSVEIFGDDWIDKEENSKLCDILLSWLLNESDLDMSSDRKESEISDYRPVPNIETLSQVLKPCLQGMDELPRDFTKLFDLKMFKFDVDLIPKAVKLYETLGVPHEPLTLIPPQFVCPLPKLGIATFPPAMREPSAPALDQFDLDEHFAKEGLRLAQLTNKCSNSDEDLEYYIAESGEILGISQTLPFGERSAKHILFNIFKQIVDYKKSDFGKYDAAPAYPVDHQEFSSYANNDSFDQIQTYPEYNQSKHLAHVDLAPMKIDPKKSNLMVLDPTLQIGGPAIGNIVSNSDFKSDYKSDHK